MLELTEVEIGRPNFHVGESLRHLMRAWRATVKSPAPSEVEDLDFRRGTPRHLQHGNLSPIGRTT